MPSIANIVVKKNDGVTDVTFTYQQPSSGDGSFAVWQNTAIGTSPSHRPELRLVAREAAKGSSRALRSTFVYPQIATNSTTTVTSVVNRALASTDWTIPKDMSAADINEFAAQYANLMAAALMKSCVQQGYAAS